MEPHRWVRLGSPYLADFRNSAIRLDEELAEDHALDDGHQQVSAGVVEEASNGAVTHQHLHTPAALIDVEDVALRKR